MLTKPVFRIIGGSVLKGISTFSDEVIIANLYFISHIMNEKFNNINALKLIFPVL